MKRLNPVHDLLPVGFRKFKMCQSIVNTVCPGCLKKNCGIIWFARKRKNDPCTGVTVCEKALVWHDWEYTQVGHGGEKFGIDYFFRPTLFFYEKKEGVFDG